MKFLQDQATYVIDTSQLLTRELKEEIGKLVPTDDDTLKIVGDWFVRMICDLSRTDRQCSTERQTDPSTAADDP